MLEVSVLLSIPDKKDFHDDTWQIIGPLKMKAPSSASFSNRSLTAPEEFCIVHLAFNFFFLYGTENLNLFDKSTF